MIRNQHYSNQTYENNKVCPQPEIPERKKEAV